MKKVIVLGFPHGGTTILRSVIGHIEDVHDCVDEARVIPPLQEIKKFAVCKTPVAHDKFFEDEYKDYIKILIVRNPLYVFSSHINRVKTMYSQERQKEIIDQGFRQSFDVYTDVLEKFTKYRDTPRDDVYTIRYEDMFDNNYAKLREIFDSIGFEYDDTIFDNSRYENKQVSRARVPKTEPSMRDIVLYRTWQINQPFVSNNIPSNLSLTDEQKAVISSNETISKVYPNLS